MEYAVETISLTKTFSDWWGRDKVIAVDNLNLQIKYNEIFGLLGPNGSGKTTTLKLLLGLLYPTKGKAIILGGDGADPKVNTRIGFLPEESYLYRYLTARETLDFYGRLFDLPAKIRKTRIEALLDMVGLKAVANRPVGTFSKGMARRIGLAQALINDPDLLILDEPTTGLDPIGTRQIKDLIMKLAERGKTVLLCSHLLADVEDVCDRISILYGGKIQAQGRVKDLLLQTDKKQITTSNLSDAAVERITEILKAEHAQCEITSPMERLESFFIKTITTAQEQAQPTSGAVSTTQIGNFLVSAPSTDNILDKLVSAGVSKEPSRETPATRQLVPAKAAESKPDQELLSRLTKPDDSAMPKPVVRDDKVKTEPVESGTSEKDHIQKSILDQLAGRSSGFDKSTTGEQEEQNKKNEKDNPNAEQSTGDLGNA
jgi:ABC-2 type transport system ATP-binding protein